MPSSKEGSPGVDVGNSVRFVRGRQDRRGYREVMCCRSMQKGVEVVHDGRCRCRGSRNDELCVGAQATRMMCNVEVLMMERI